MVAAGPYLTSGFTTDTIFDGRLTLLQPGDGYRFSIDALLLACFLGINPGQTVVDLGAGVGVIALATAFIWQPRRVWAVEVQPRPAACARMNIERNAAGAVVRVLEANWSDLTLSMIDGPVDAVVCNPPYRELGTGRVNPDLEEAAARHEIMGSAGEAARIAAGLLKPRGRLAMIYPASRLVDLVFEMRSAGLEPKRLRLVHSRAGEQARLALVEARLGAGAELLVQAPLYVYQRGREYTEECRAILSGSVAAGPAGRPAGP